MRMIVLQYYTVPMSIHRTDLTSFKPWTHLLLKLEGKNSFCYYVLSTVLWGWA